MPPVLTVAAQGAVKCRASSRSPSAPLTKNAALGGEAENVALKGHWQADPAPRHPTLKDATLPQYWPFPPGRANAPSTKRAGFSGETVWLPERDIARKRKLVCATRESVNH